jgi:F-type H+-transporting ATPase subunit delta
MQGSLARRYAKAFLEITTQNGTTDDVLRELLVLADLLAASKDLQIAFTNPAIDREKRVAVLQDILHRISAGPDTKRFVAELLARDRLPVLRDIALAFQELADARAGRVRVEVIAAQRLDETRLWRIQQSLEGVTGKKVIVQQHTDADLLAGVVVKLGSLVYDGSLRTQMKQLREALLEA